MKEAILIFPTQLFKENPALKKDRTILLIESKRYFCDFKFHKYKLILHRASMKYYADYLSQADYKVKYIEFNQDLEKIASTFDKCHYLEVFDNKLENEINSLKTKIQKHTSPAFITSKDEFTNFFQDKKQLSMTPFYIYLRKKHKILLEKGKAKGGKWTYDKENRKKLPSGIKLPIIKKLRTNKYITEAKNYVEKHFPDNYGETQDFFYPTMHEEAQKWLQDFFKNRLDSFGEYEDAICEKENFLFHSVLSSSINIGLLTPMEVIKETIAFAKKYEVPLNSLEGFIRQILGWREYIKNIYLTKGEIQRKSNFWNHKNQLPYSFYDASTNIIPIDNVIKKVFKHAYCHHIERLMVLSNFMLLCEINPNDVYNWFMELYIDAYDWVMIPNVYGMGIFADGGLMMSKPYISSSNYINKMSDFSQGDWCEIWDGLYWRFIANHTDYFEKNPRLRIITTYLARIDEKKLKKHIETANIFLSKLHKGNGG